MPPPADPYRTLGLTRGASIDEVRRAYRRLAKLHHPDTGGEAAVPRFLAIRAAYEQIVGPGRGGTGTPRAARQPSQPWSADPDRANATHRAYGGRSRRTRPTSGPGARTTPPPPPPPRPDAAGDDPSTAESKKATLGSTSYDGADREPFDPDWGGASWYGTTSGTYWTINPKEYADPRKHGPEYQARARRQAADADVDPIADPLPEPPPIATTDSWWEATAGPDPDAVSASSGARVAADGPADPGSRLNRFVLEMRRRVGRPPRP
jgi:hypothetical protein